MTLYEAVGEADVERLALAWHHRCLADEVVAHAFSHGYRDDHVERLAAYWVEALGGPAAFTDRLGDETAVVRMHSGNGAHDEMDERAIACFAGALTDVGIEGDVASGMMTWFRASIARMAQYPHAADDVPAGLVVPVWDARG